MREVVFLALTERPGHLRAQAETLTIRTSAPTLKELQHEAREALIEYMGAAHCTIWVRVRRSPSVAGIGSQPAPWPLAAAARWSTNPAGVN